MFAMPDAPQLVELAASLNLHMSPSEPSSTCRSSSMRCASWTNSCSPAPTSRRRPGCFPERGPRLPSLARGGPLPGLALEVRPSAARAAACWPQDGQLQRSRERGRHPAGLHLAGHGGLRPDVDATIGNPGCWRPAARSSEKAHDERLHGDFGKPLNPHNPERITGGSVVGLRRGAGGRRGGHLVRRRPGRLHPPACRLLRRGRTEADLRAGVALRGRLRRRAERRSRRAGWRARCKISRPPCRRWPGTTATTHARARYPESIDPLTDLDRGVRGLKIGILQEGFAEPIEPEVAAGVLKAVSTLEKLGAEVKRSPSRSMRRSTACPRRCPTRARGRSSTWASTASAPRPIIPPRS